MVASRAETLGGDEASRFRTIPLSLVMEGMNVSEHARVCGRETERVLFRVGVGNERVNHEIAAENMRQKGRSRMISGGTVTYTCSKAGSKVLGWWTSRAGIGGGFGGEDEQWSDHGHLFIYRPR